MTEDGSQSAARISRGRDETPAHHATWTESSMRHLQCFRNDEVVAIPRQNEQNMSFCPSCGARWSSSRLAQLEQRFPGLFMTAGVFGAALLMAAAAHVLPPDYGSGEIYTGEITLVGIGLLFVASVALATLANWAGSVVGDPDV